MLKIKLIVMGKLKERYWQDAVNEYQKRLQRYCQLQIISLKDEVIRPQAKELEIKQVLEKEGKQILAQIKDTDYVVVLAIQGEMISSTKLSTLFETYEQMGKQLVYVIGSSNGLASGVYKRANYQLSISPMTFVHQMMQVILLEQIYRAFKIKHQEKYHK